MCVYLWLFDAASSIFVLPRTWKWWIYSLGDLKKIFVQLNLVNLLKRRGISYILTKSFWWISIYITLKTFFWAFMVISFYIPTVHKVVWNEVETSNLQNTNWLMVWCVSHQKEYGKKGRENIGPILKQASF